MNIYEKIEQIFEHEDPNKPRWVEEVLKELREIKEKIGTRPSTTTQMTPPGKKHHYDFYKFINDFRRQMRADVENNIYPEIEFEGKKYGVNFKGLLYDKATSAIVSTTEATKIYRFLYNNKQDSV